MALDAVCFDLDDTLYEYRQYARTGLLAAADRLERLTGQRHHEELLDLYFGAEHTDGTFDRLLDRNDYPTDYVDDLVDAYHDASASLSPYPETRDVLDELAGDHRLGLITDGRGGHRKLDRLDLREPFEAILVTPTIDRSKHDPVVFERVLAVLSVPATRTAYVGDDPRVDFRVPNDLGMTTVRVRRGRYTHLDPPDAAAAPDHEIDTLTDLLSLTDAATTSD